MVAAKPLKDHLQTHTFVGDGEKERLLRSSVIYGPNAGGKTNFFKSLAFLKNMVINSSLFPAVGGIVAQPLAPFLFQEGMENEPSEFELEFKQELEGRSILFRYALTLNRERVVRENLSYAPKGRMVMLFKRDGQNIEIGTSYKEGKGLTPKARENALFLSTVAQFNGAIARAVTEWFAKVTVVATFDDAALQSFVHDSWFNRENKRFYLDFINIADPSITNIELQRELVKKDSLPPEVPDAIRSLIAGQVNEFYAINKFSHHRRYSKGGDVVGDVAVPFDIFESEGTRQMFSLGPVVKHVFDSGGCLFMDELDSHLHPLLSQFIIDLFHSEANKKNAQLIVSTHDINLLNRSVFRRDQVWFIEKDHQSGSSLYSLAEYRVRKDASFDKDYLAGKYGAIPEASLASIVGSF